MFAIIPAAIVWYVLIGKARPSAQIPPISFSLAAACCFVFYVFGLYLQLFDRLRHPRRLSPWYVYGLPYAQKKKQVVLRFKEQCRIVARLLITGSVAETIFRMASEQTVRIAAAEFGVLLGTLIVFWGLGVAALHGIRPSKKDRTQASNPFSFSLKKTKRSSSTIARFPFIFSPFKQTQVWFYRAVIYSGASGKTAQILTVLFLGPFVATAAMLLTVESAQMSFLAGCLSSLITLSLFTDDLQQSIQEAHSSPWLYLRAKDAFRALGMFHLYAAVPSLGATLFLTLFFPLSDSALLFGPNSALLSHLAYALQAIAVTGIIIICKTAPLVLPPAALGRVWILLACLSLFLAQVGVIVACALFCALALQYHILCNRLQPGKPSFAQQTPEKQS